MKFVVFLCNYSSVIANVTVKKSYQSIRFTVTLKGQPIGCETT